MAHKHRKQGRKKKRDRMKWQNPRGSKRGGRRSYIRGRVKQNLVFGTLCIPIKGEDKDQKKKRLLKKKRNRRRMKKFIKDYDNDTR